jgi:ribosomal protein S18 acetylase RimI-like enzyme
VRPGPPVVRVATLDDREVLVRVLVRAFEADPVASYLLRADAGRARAFHDVFDVAFRRWTLPVGGAWLTEGGGGAALWTPPGEWKAWRAWPDVLALGGAVGVTRLPRILPILRRAGRNHPLAPHWYLFAIGVDPDEQGRGLGAALLRPVLELCDARGEAAYLEASTEANARLYARHGFRVAEAFDLAKGAPTVRLMWRDPIALRTSSR